MKAKRQSPITRRQLLCVAIGMTLGCWVIAAAMPALIHHRPISRAAAVGVVAALGGLVNWVSYRITTRSQRIDGLAAFIVAMVVTTGGHRDNLSLQEELARALFLVIFMAPWHALVGWFVRERPKVEVQSIPPPLWDAHVDPPLSG